MPAHFSYGLPGELDEVPVEMPHLPGRFATCLNSVFLYTFYTSDANAITTDMVWRLVAICLAVPNIQLCYAIDLGEPRVAPFCIIE